MGSLSEASEFEGSFVWSLIGMFCYAMPEDTASEKFTLVWSNMELLSYGLVFCLPHQEIERM